MASQKWCYLSTSIILKCPCSVDDDGASEKFASQQLQEMINLLNKYPAYVHSISPLKKMALEDFSSTKICSTDDSGRCATCD